MEMEQPHPRGVRGGGRVSELLSVPVVRKKGAI